jgi:hypothetical protein
LKKESYATDAAAPTQITKIIFGCVGSVERNGNGRRGESNMPASCFLQI